MKIEIHVLSQDGTPIELSLVEAKELFQTLKDLFEPEQFVLAHSNVTGAR